MEGWLEESLDIDDDTDYFGLSSSKLCMLILVQLAIIFGVAGHPNFLMRLEGIKLN